MESYQLKIIMAKIKSSLEGLDSRTKMIVHEFGDRSRKMI